MQFLYAENWVTSTAAAIYIYVLYFYFAYAQFRSIKYEMNLQGVEHSSMHSLLENFKNLKETLSKIIVFCTLFCFNFASFTLIYISLIEWVNIEMLKTFI